MVEQQRQYSRY